MKVNAGFYNITAVQHIVAQELCVRKERKKFTWCSAKPFHQWLQQIHHIRNYKTFKTPKKFQSSTTLVLYSIFHRRIVVCSQNIARNKTIWKKIYPFFWMPLQYFWEYYRGTFKAQNHAWQLRCFQRHNAILQQYIICRRTRCE